MKFYSLFFLIVILACEPSSNEDQQASENTATPTDLPEMLQAALAAHGGLEKWQSMRTLEYDIQKDSMTTEHQLIDLQSRKVLLSTDQYRVGFDGKEVWVAPDKAAFGKGSARFYHNLRFYFYAMPFIVADPGINYEAMPNLTFNDQIYDALKVTYNANIGDAPEDEYILYFNQNTHEMEWLLYTVTYYTQQKGDQYNALHYNEWENVNGLKLPKTLTGYTFQNDSIGEQRYERVFENATITEEVADAAIFEMPEQAEVDSLVTAK